MKRNVHRVIAGVVSSLAISIIAASPSRAAGQDLEVEEPWFFVIDGMVSGPINDLATQQFDVGGSGALGAYRSFAPEIAFGLRLGGGALSPGEVIVQDPVDRGWLDFGQLSASMRVRPLARLMNGRRGTGLWIQMGAGPWLVDGDVIPVFDAGLGYGFELGPIVLSPMGQFTHMVETEDRFGQGFVLVWNGGLEITFLDEAHTRPPEGALDMKPVSELAAGPPPAPIEREAPPPAVAPEPLPEEEDIAQPFIDDQLVIDERVFFDFDRWELRETGMEQLDEVARRYEESGDRWAALVISGHADRRGPEAYNVDLSRKRAEAVLRYLEAHGVPREVVEIEAWGESRPEIPDAETEYDHQVNRRVQFDIVWREGMRPEGEAPAPDPPEPDYVDPAPPGVRDAE
ncbi:OmpA family protein [Sandaracinus amylolyticus]|uniref:OmpA family protein n=1 Tax=Sandaracinus amylolyticus TaxID=927083 RepID=UPI001F3AEC0C|nr:OmpA family protein [Sandaracinus amylolyticus]UJR78420.1 Outer membrane protein A [Sandaracinus amylolyticus]